MSDMYGALRSNVFKVKDPIAFRTWFEKVYFGDEIQLWEGNVHGTFSFGGYEQYPSAYPRKNNYEAIQNSENGGDGNDEEYYPEMDLTDFAKQVLDHLEPDQFLQVVAGGNEKLRYVAFSVLIITHHRPPVFFNASSDDEDLFNTILKAIPV